MCTSFLVSLCVLMVCVAEREEKSLHISECDGADKAAPSHSSVHCPQHQHSVFALHVMVFAVAQVRHSAIK